MWPDAHSAVTSAANRVNLFCGDFRRIVAERNDRKNARRRQNFYPPLEPAAEKHVAGKQRQLNRLVTILPAPDLGVFRLKGLKALGGQQPRHGRFVLVFCGQNEPVRLFLLDHDGHLPTASPCDSHSSCSGFEPSQKSLSYWLGTLCSKFDLRTLG